MNISYNGSDNLTISFPNNLPSFATFNTNKIIFSPTTNDTGEYIITIRIQNSTGSSITIDSFIVDVFSTNNYTPSPDDWRKKIMYLIMVDRFNNGDNSNDQLNVGNEYDPTHRGKIHGGDIKGIITKIPYLKELGITAIWLTPVLKNKPTYHGYSIQNFKAIDPHFGTLDEYKELVRIAHQNSISVLMDVVVNHSADLIGNTQNNYSFNYPQGYTLKWNNNNLKHEPKYLANLNFFHNYGNIGWGWDDPIEGVVGDFYGLDDFKTEHPEVQKILSYIYMWWILKTDIDGFRIDTAKHVDMSFWEYFLPYIRSEAAKINKTKFFMFGEIWSDYNDEMIGKYSGTKYNSSKYLFESLTYFTMKNTILEVFKYQGATNKITERRSYLNYYDNTVHDKLVTFFDNHDLDRFNSRKQSSTQYIQNSQNYYDNLKLAYLFISTYPGIPCLYYGTEQGFDGYKLDIDYGDGYVREDMWDGLFEFGPSLDDNFDTTHILFQFIKNVNEKINSEQYNFIRTGNFAELKSDETAGIYAFSRYTTDSEAIIILNNSNTQRTNIILNTSLNYPNGKILYNIFDNNDNVIVTNNQINISINAMGYKIYSN